MKYLHNSRKIEFRTPPGSVRAGSELRLAIHVNEHVNSVRLFIRRDGRTPSPLMMSESIPGYYSVRFRVPEDPCLLWYYFEIEERSRGFVYYGNNAGMYGGAGACYAGNEKIPEYQITVYKEAAVPEWYRNAIVYQIFPDRFNRDIDWKERTRTVIDERNNCIEKNGAEDMQQQLLEGNWFRPSYYVRDTDGAVLAWPIYGGSLRGISAKLEYLASLGVTAIYLNPIFKAVSNHRYDTADYFSIDPILGSEADFADLARKAESFGIRIILDGVFSHTGAESIYFDRYGNCGGEGAWGNPSSKYRHWYSFGEYEPDGYKCWWGVKDLPEVDENNLSYRTMICGKEGVLRKWLKLGASGWRLDVADELPDSFISAIRRTVKNAGEDNVLIGEVWEDASNKISYGERRSFLLGDELDSTMNYPLRAILLDFINYTISAEEAAERIESLKENYPPEQFYGALNLLGTHDRPRILTMMGADSDYDSAALKLKLLAVLQYTLPGVPCIYYGDEAGMYGGDDPENRSGYIWGKENTDIRGHYEMLGRLYREHSALRDGELEFIASGCDDVMAFCRENADEKIYILTNRSYGPSEAMIDDDPEHRISMDRLSCRIIPIRKKHN